jgi:CTP synthase
MSKRRAHKYIFVIGGVMSGVGKGIAVASVGKILSARGYKVNLVKVDPYLNVDAGTMNPTEHGEVFVLNSGLETDQDMGNYERFLDRDLPSEDYMTSGMVYKTVIEKERNLDYGGKCVEAIPHIRDEILKRFEKASAKNGSEISVIEVGGTIGDFQNMMFIEAARVLAARNPDDVCFILVSFLPIPGTLGEMKTKPTQNAIRQLNSYGVQPDIVIARAKVALDAKRKLKIATSCAIKPEHVISAPDVTSVYDVPINFERDKLSETLIKELGLSKRKGTGLSSWKRFAGKAHNGNKKVKIGIVGKYFDTGDFVLTDAYISVIEALKYSAFALNVKVDLTWLNAKTFERGGSALKKLTKYDGILVPGGFGETGVEGKIKAIKFARENKIPYFGLCYGMQLMVIEYARNVAKLSGAHTVEINNMAKHAIIDVMPDQKEKIENKKFGGTMRLGAYPCYLKRGTIARKSYKQEMVSERHRHRYEVNPNFIEKMEKAGLVFSGVSPDKRLMEIAELPQKDHPFMLGTQFHPEFQARPLSPHPLFTAFLKASLGK